MKAILLLSKYSSLPAIEATVNDILGAGSKVAINDASTILSFICNLMSPLLGKMQPSRACSLSTEAGKTLRSLIFQGLHGAATADKRSRCLSSTVFLLRILNPSWTIESASEIVNESKGKFAVFLCSIIRTELHIALEEINFFLAEKTAMTDFHVEFERSFNAVSNSLDIIDTITDFLLDEYDDISSGEDLSNINAGTEEIKWTLLPYEIILKIQTVSVTLTIC
jgi:hypothetical protein